VRGGSGEGRRGFYAQPTDAGWPGEHRLLDLLRALAARQADGQEHRAEPARPRSRGVSVSLHIDAGAVASLDRLDVSGRAVARWIAHRRYGTSTTRAGAPAGGAGSATDLVRAELATLHFRVVRVARALVGLAFAFGAPRGGAASPSELAGHNVHLPAGARCRFRGEALLCGACRKPSGSKQRAGGPAKAHRLSLRLSASYGGPAGSTPGPRRESRRLNYECSAPAARS